MKYRKLGHTDIDVSVICLGSMTWGQQNTAEQAFEQMDYALSQGVNFFDTAELYAIPPKAETYGRTEEIIGAWLKARAKREQIVLASKIAGPGEEWIPHIRNGRTRFNRTDISAAVYASLQRLTGNTVDAVVQSIVDGVLAGHNPRKIARAIQGAFGRGLTDALRNTRTVQIWSYRDSARANYTATGGIVQGWVWYARLDGLTCMSCVSQHGSIHELSETLDDHDNGRCAPLPYIPEFGNPVQQRGQDWFSGLPQAEQKKQMGASKWQAWQDDKFQFDQLSHQRPDDRYGTMRSEASLKQLVGEQ